MLFRSLDVLLIKINAYNARQEAVKTKPVTMLIVDPNQSKSTPCSVSQTPAAVTTFHLNLQGIPSAITGAKNRAQEQQQPQRRPLSSR